MSKVLVERTRFGAKDARPGRPERDPEFCDRASRRIQTKALNENLAPLKRYLRSHVGQRWDAVHSDLSQPLSARSAVQQHVRDHLSDFVARKVSFHQGVPYEPSQPVPVRHFYVCPVTGLLCELVRRKRPAPGFEKRGCRCSLCRHNVITT